MHTFSSEEGNNGIRRIDYSGFGKLLSVRLAFGKLRGFPSVGSATEMRVDFDHARLCTLQYSVDTAALGHRTSM